MENIVGQIGFVIGTSFMYSAPLIFTALGGVVTENSGVVNIGLEGMMVGGAFAGAAVAYYAGDPWIGFLCAGLAGSLLALLHAVACITLRANQVVSGIAINFIGPGLSLFISRLIFDGATQTLTVKRKIPRPFEGFFGEGGLFPHASFFDQVFNKEATVFIAFALAFAVWFLLYRTRLGLRIRAVGEHPEAADTLGISVSGIRYFSVVLSGFLAGLGGAAMSIAVVSQFSPTGISGHGFIAMAAMIFGKWKPQGALAACLLFGAAKGLEIFLGSTDLKVASEILAMLPYALTLVILVGFVGRAVAPAASGLAYGKED